MQKYIIISNYVGKTSGLSQNDVIVFSLCAINIPHPRLGEKNNVTMDTLIRFDWYMSHHHGYRRSVILRLGLECVANITSHSSRGLRG